LLQTGTERAELALEPQGWNPESSLCREPAL